MRLNLMITRIWSPTVAVNHEPRIKLDGDWSLGLSTSTSNLRRIHQRQLCYNIVPCALCTCACAVPWCTVCGVNMMYLWQFNFGCMYTSSIHAFVSVRSSMGFTSADILFCHFRYWDRHNYHVVDDNWWITEQLNALSHKRPFLCTFMRWIM